MISDPQSPPIVAPTQPDTMSTQAPDGSQGRLNQALPPWQQRMPLPAAGMAPRPQVSVPQVGMAGPYGPGAGYGPYGPGGFSGFGGGNFGGGYGGGYAGGGGMYSPPQWAPPPWMAPPWMQGNYGMSAYQPPPLLNPWTMQPMQSPRGQPQGGYRAPNGNTGVAGPMNGGQAAPMNGGQAATVPAPQQVNQAQVRPAPQAPAQPQPNYGAGSATPIIDKQNERY